MDRVKAVVWDEICRGPAAVPNQPLFPLCLSAKQKTMYAELRRDARHQNKHILIPVTLTNDQFIFVLAAGSYLYSFSKIPAHLKRPNRSAPIDTESIGNGNLTASSLTMRPPSVNLSNPVAIRSALNDGLNMPLHPSQSPQKHF